MRPDDRRAAGLPEQMNETERADMQMQQENRTGRAFIWKLMERFSVTAVQFVIQIFLARLLMPKDFDVIALMLIFIQVANVIVQSGFNSALIQGRDVLDEDYSSVFWLNLVLSSMLVGVLFLASPAIAAFFGQPILAPALRVLSLILIPGAVNSVQIAYLSRRLNFRAMFISNLIATALSGTVGVVCAFCGLGVWSLVVQQLANQLVVAVVMGAVVRWRPKRVFCLGRIRRLFGFGFKILASGLIDTVYNNIYGLVVGKLFPGGTLGYYNRAQQFPVLIQDTLNGAISSVLLPVMSRQQDEPKRIRDMLRKSMVLSTYVVFPMLVGLAVCARPVIVLLMTEKWLPAVPYLQILCLTYILFPIHTSNLQAITAIGRSDIFLKLEVLKKLIGVLSIVVTVPFGVLAMTWSKLTTGVIASVINAAPNKRLLDYAYLDQIRDLLPNIMATAGMAALTLLAGLLPLGNAVLLAVQVIVGVGSYGAISMLFHLEGFELLKTHVLGALRQGGKRAA